MKLQTDGFPDESLADLCETHSLLRPLARLPCEGARRTLPPPFSGPQRLDLLSLHQRLPRLAVVDYQLNSTHKPNGSDLQHLEQPSDLVAVTSAIGCCARLLAKWNLSRAPHGSTGGAGAEAAEQGRLPQFYGLSEFAGCRLATATQKRGMLSSC